MRLFDMCSTNVAKTQRLWCRRSSSAPSANLQPAHIVEHRCRPQIGLSPPNLPIAHGKPHDVSRHRAHTQARKRIFPVLSELGTGTGANDRGGKV